MSKQNQNDNILDKIIDLELLYSIKNSEIYLKFLDNQIKFYQNQITFLEDNKPLFFQKKNWKNMLEKKKNMRKKYMKIIVK